MIYGWTINDILVQRYYYCGGSNHRSKHKILSTDQDILPQLSANESSAMQFKLGHSIDSVLQNKLSITSLSGLFQQQFQENELLCFPCRNIVETISLESFIEHRSLYERFMDDIAANSISMDHTFKVSKKHWCCLTG